MTYVRAACLLLIMVVVMKAPAAARAAELWVPVGAAKVDVTPTHPVVLAGYGGRVGEHEAVDQRIWARAIVIGDASARVLVSVDNCGVPAPVVETVARRLKDRLGAQRSDVVVCSTHTHNAPSLADYAPIVWRGRTTPEQDRHVRQYTEWLTDRIVEVAMEAARARQPARLAWNQGVVTFGGNRRLMSDRGWEGFGLQPDAPVDHSLPMLVAAGRDGKPIAIWSNYACHCTTLGGVNHIAGDWAGFACEAIEEQHPGAIALMTIGCGADIGPQPSGSTELAKRHGRSIASEVARLMPQAAALTTPPRSTMRRIKLPLAELPSREHWEERAKQQDFDGQHAQLMLERLDRDGELVSHVDYPITVWSFGDELSIVFLAGEVCVDYAVRLKTELDYRRLWINGWSNDVPCYIPSKRVLDEGGYEADFSMIYYAQPNRFADEVEDVLIGAVKEMLPASLARHDGEPPTFLRRRINPQEIRDRLRAWADGASDEGKDFVRELLPLMQRSRSGFGQLVSNDGQEAIWYDFTGAMRRRPFIRQTSVGQTLRWSVPEYQPGATSEGEVFVFLGGIGWEGEPATDGFSLLLGDRELLSFDVSTTPRRWRSADGQATLHYLPTWVSNGDSGGFFYLVVDRDLLTGAQPHTLAVRSRGRDSKRWFAVDTITDIKPIERHLSDALRAIEVAR